jgi:hypothetical protein
MISRYQYRLSRVANTAFAIPGLRWDQKVRFRLDDVSDIDWALDLSDSLSAMTEELPDLGSEG